jgi:hypothetical protein
MAADLSDLELPALVERMQDARAHVRHRRPQPGTLAPGERVRAAEHVQILAATLDNLHREASRSPWTPLCGRT